MSIYKENMNITTFMNSNSKWKILEKLYDKNILYDNNDVIPKIIHQIWLGSELPQEAKILSEKVKSINKNFEYRLWTDKDVDVFGLKNKELFNNIKNLGAKSDIFRYEILERIGGIYLDTDFICVKPFDNLLHLDFWAGNGHVSEPDIFNSIMASKPNDKIISKIVSELQKKKNFVDNIDGVMNNTGPYFITKCFYDVVNEDDKCIIYPTTYFFPFPATLRHSKNERLAEQFIHKNTYAIHLWKTTWQK